ncbi:MAG: cryptochrome/photolyase family protein, partial [Xanthomonadales bacterium]|nr:cryptochrome/photolyase family protein [Xanthomonadales bacterium]
ATHVWSHKARIVQFLAAMRHFRAAREAEGREVIYRSLGAHPHRSLAACLAGDIESLGVSKVLLMEAGDYRVQHGLVSAIGRTGAELEVIDDPHFLCSRTDFEAWLAEQKQPRMEFFYRRMRKRYDVLMEDGEPVGGKWNLDRENRASFDRDGPPGEGACLPFEPNELTRVVIDLVEERFPDHPGELDDFGWPVTPEQARRALDDFIANRLEDFGTYQDAMWTGRPFLFHARISSALNLKLLDPRQAIEAAQKAYGDGAAPLNSVEGFIRQILGWREYIRGIYLARMPGYLEVNTLDHREALPEFYWTGETTMNCVSEVVRQTLRYGYAHHIQRLMVTGLFGLLYGIEPRELHEWYLAVYVDAVEWVEAPNTIGMSQYADGGFLASKPYAATGKYIQRMSNYCDGCRYKPAEKVGPKACPFTTFYWDFLLRHEDRFRDHPRMALQVRNLDRLDDQTREAIQSRASELRSAVLSSEL